MILYVALLVWPAWRLARGAWCRVEMPGPGELDFVTLTWADGVTEEYVHAAVATAR